MKQEVYNLKAEKLKDIDLKSPKEIQKVNPQLLKDYIVAYNHNQRQWSANTKTRAEVSHSTKKPHRQKGTGKARQGSLSAPQFKGGGVVFGPRPKFDQHVRINQKEKRAVIRYLIEEKIHSKKLVILDSSELKEPKTKTLAAFIEKTGLQKRVLFIGDMLDAKTNSESQKNLKLSLRNIPKVEFAHLNQINGYQLLKAENIIMTEAGLKQFMELTK
jgi:large subunit ribosomal protein L4